MERNEIKKEIYKKNPTAKLMYIRKGIAKYISDLYYIEDAGINNIYFDIPVEDMRDADFLPEMQAKLLIRWLQ
jgi:hypothetical protein